MGSTVVGWVGQSVVVQHVGSEVSLRVGSTGLAALRGAGWVGNSVVQHVGDLLFLRVVSTAFASVCATVCVGHWVAVPHVVLFLSIVLAMICGTVRVEHSLTVLHGVSAMSTAEPGGLCPGRAVV